MKSLIFLFSVCNIFSLSSQVFIDEDSEIALLNKETQYTLNVENIDFNKNFYVKKDSIPELFWNEVADGGKIEKSQGLLSCNYRKYSSLSQHKDDIQIISYNITIDGIVGGLQGLGGTISPSHLLAIKGFEGRKINIEVEVKGSYKGKVSASFY